MGLRKILSNSIKMNNSTIDLFRKFPKSCGGKRIDWSLKFDIDEGHSIFSVQARFIIKESTSWEGNGQSMWDYLGNSGESIDEVLESALRDIYKRVKRITVIYFLNPLSEVPWREYENQWLSDNHSYSQ